MTRRPVSPVRDVFGRPMTDLRISVTDRCNFRCVFCMPPDRVYAFLPREELLTFEEITRLARLFVEMGVRKIRITGGEPLLRSEIEKLIAMLARIPGLEDLALTTNGYLLAQKAAALKAAGLRRVTVSLHALEDSTFGQINGRGIGVSRVLEGIERAVEVGLVPVKIDVVVLRGVNDHQVVELARFFKRPHCVVRFIEYMDVGTVNGWNLEKVVPAREIVEMIDRAMPLEPLPREYAGEVALRFRYRDDGTEVGVIASVTEPFCGDCSRVRLSSDGRLYTCLFAAEGHDLKGPLRAGATDEELKAIIASVWSRRTDRYSEERTAALRQGQPRTPVPKVEMFRIGG